MNVSQMNEKFLMVKLLSITIKESLTACIHFSTPGRCSMLNYSAKLCANSVVPSFCKAGQLQQHHVGELSMEAPLSPFNLVKVYLEKSDMFPQISILELIAQAIMWVQFIGTEICLDNIHFIYRCQISSVGNHLPVKARLGLISFYFKTPSF